MDFRAVIFVPALVGGVIFGFVFLLFAAHYYLTVLESTGAGAKHVTWVSEPITDHFWKLAYLLWLVGLWLGPAYIVGRTMTVGTGDHWLRLAVPLAVIWLCFPVSQLSSLSASTIWLPLVPDVFVRLAQKPGVVFGFFLLSAGVLAVFGVGFRWAFQTDGEWHLLFVGAPLMVVAGLLYARLIGRLAYALRFTRGLFPEKKKKKTKPEAKPKQPTDDVMMPTIRQPEELPPIQTTEGELIGYNILMEDEALKPPRKRVRAEVVEAENDTESPVQSTSSPLPLDPDRGIPDDEETTNPYELHPAEGMTAEELPEQLVNPRADELALLDRRDAPRKSKQVWGPDLLAFMAQPETILAVVIASGFCVVVGAMVRIARDFNPTAST